MMKNKALSKKLKYGSAAVLLTVVFVAFVIALNAVISAVANKYPMYLDMTNESLYDISETTVNELSELPHKVDIMFFAKEDRLSEVGGTYLETISTLAKKYEASFDNVKVSYFDLVSQPNIANKYKKTSADKVTQSTVIFYCEDTGASKIVQLEGFYTFMQKDDGSRVIYSFDGEKRITSYIKQMVNAETPLALFTTGHGEPSPDAVWMGNSLSDEGYEVKTVNLTSESIDEKAELLVIYYPAYDFAGLEAEKAGGANEISKVNDYLKNFGNVIVILSPTTKTELSELSALLTEWGISHTPGAIVTDSPANTLDSEGFYIIGDYAGEKDGFAYQLHKGVSEQPSAPKPIVAYSVPLEVKSVSGRIVEPVVVSSDAAYIATSEKTAAAGRAVPLVALSTMTKNDTEGNLGYCNLLVVGSPYFFDSGFASIASYGNSELFYATLKYFGNTSTALNIETKVLENTELKTTATGDTVKTGIVIMSVIAPLIILAIGIFVWRKRRFS